MAKKLYSANKFLKRNIDNILLQKNKLKKLSTLWKLFLKNSVYGLLFFIILQHGRKGIIHH